MTLRGSLLLPSHVVHLRSDRLVMRRFTADDDDLLVELDSDPEVVKFVGGVPSALSRIQNEVMPRVLGYYEKWTDLGIWATHEREGGAFIGWFHYRPAHAEPHEPELGYRLRRASWNKGYATEMSRAILAHAFDALGHTRVIARADVANRASWHVMEKLGMTRERVAEEDGVPTATYGIDRATWAARR